jgi:hypothetical protein
MIEMQYLIPLCSEVLEGERSIRTGAWAIVPACGLAILIGAIGAARADDVKSAYPAMAPIGQYLMANPADEIALARSAAPASISGDADVQTLGIHGYESAVKGKNGFVCMVWRSWTAPFDTSAFWNPTLRAPICLNAAAVRSVLPVYLERTKWALAGVSKAEMISRTGAAVTANTFTLPVPGAMSYMTSKQASLGAAGHYRPHLMFFFARTEVGTWGANLGGSPVVATQDDHEPTTTFTVLVPEWSDGTPAIMEKH